MNQNHNHNHNGRSESKGKSSKQATDRKIYFVHALSTIPVPPALTSPTGVPVVHVAANGSTRLCTLSLSPDKFTLTLTPQNLPKQKSSIRKGFLFRSSSANSSSVASTVGAETPPTGSAASQNFVRSIDISEISRIQRGQSTIDFEKAIKKKKKAAQYQQQPSLTSRYIGKPSAIALRTVSSSSSGGTIPSGNTSADKTVSVNGTAAITGTSSTYASSTTGSDRTAKTSNTSSNHTQQDLLGGFDPMRSFSIIFRGSITLDLLMATDETISMHANAPAISRDELCTALDRLILAYEQGKTRVAPDVQLLRYYMWLLHRQQQQSQPNGENNTGDITTYYSNCQQIQLLLHQMNFYSLKPREIQANYDKFGKILGLDRAQRRRGLTFEQTATFLHKLKRDSSWMVKPTSRIWNELFGEVMNNGKLRTTVSDRTFLERFLHYKQGQMKMTLLDVRKLFRKLHDMEVAHQSQAALEDGGDLTRITKDQFEAYLLTQDNDAFDPEKQLFDRADMDQPLSEYWINTSHNTYLIGDQYKSQSSVEMYSNALYRGCRCLELDIWDGGKDPADGNRPVPVVWHGHTMTTKIRFSDIIQCIKVFLNFHPDTYPIILSFENHCSIAYQQRMAEIMERVLGDTLYIPTEASLYGRLPSPSQLQGQVVIKGRRPADTEADAYDSDDSYEEYADDDSLDGTTGQTSSMGIVTVEDLEKQKLQQKQKKLKYGIAPELARLTLLHGTKCNNFVESAKLPTYHMHSFSENKVRSRCRHKEALDWIVYNQTHMSRTYPAGSRVDSSNYNPLLAWSTGCQMVALNFQTHDNFLLLNDGRFRENGNCGYVLKPPSLLMLRQNGASSFISDELDDDSDAPTTRVRISIRVLSGSCLPKPNGVRTGDCIDPYVKITLYDIAEDHKDEVITSFPTSTVQANGFCPIWGGQEKFVFVVKNWSVAMLQLTVYSKNDEFVASTSIPISCMRKGIRNVKLYDQTNTRSGAFDVASLLLEIKTGQVIAEI